MKASIKHLVLLSIILIFNSSIAQTPAENIAAMQLGQIKKTAKHAIRKGDVYSAIDYYEYMVNKKPKNDKLRYCLASLYKETRDYEKAQKVFSDVYNSNNKKYPLAHFFKAQMLQNQERYEEAIADYKAFSKKYKGYKESRKYKKLSKLGIQGCELALINKDSLSNIVIYHLDTSINKAHIESSPFYVDEQTVHIVSLREDEINFYNLQDTNTVIPKQNFHIISRSNNDWAYSDKLDYPGQDLVNVSSGTMSKDGQRFYFTKCNKNWKNEMICKIYVSKKIGNTWSESEILQGPVNDPQYTATQPTIGYNSKNNEEVLYFVSNRPGGKGGFDIWYSTFSTKKAAFLKVKNAGSNINTKGDDVTPYYNHTNHALYFSSNYLPGYGGFDVFKNYGELRKWELAENLGPDINTGADDLHYTLSPNRKTGMFTSNRVGGVSLKNKTCCDDLYEFKYTDYIHLALDGKLIAVQDSTFYNLLLSKNMIDTGGIDLSKIEPLENYEVYLYKINKSLDTKILIGIDSTSSTGNYFFNIEVGKDYEIEIKNRDWVINKDIATSHINRSDTIHLEDILVNVLPKDPIQLNNIYYNFDKSNLTREAKKTLNATIVEILKENKKIIVEILSHTDSKGDKDYNKRLSQDRAESVIEYLIKKGINKNRLKAKGYGESRPLAPNTNPDGTDNEEGRQKNRRTEFRIIGTLGNNLEYENEYFD